MKVGLGISTALDAVAAGREAAAAALREGGIDRPDVTLLFATAAHGRGLPIVVAAAREVLGAAAATVVGGSVDGLVGPGIEIRANPAVGALAIEGLEVAPFLVQDLREDEGRAAEEIAARVAGGPTERDLVVLLADTLGLRVDPFLAGLAEHLAPATTIGTGAAAVGSRAPLLFGGSELASDGAAVAGVVIRAKERARLVATRACLPVTPLWSVTRARGNWILGLDGRPALDVYDEVARGLGLEPGRSPGRPVESLKIGIAAVGDREGEGRGQLLARNVVGLDSARRAISVPEPMASGQRVALLHLDPDAARRDLVRVLAGLEESRGGGPGAARSGFGLYLNCRERGAALFGEPGVEASELANAFAKRPIAGVIGALQFAPLAPGQPSVVQTYAGTLALVDA